jgi:hypothetical protein
LTVARRDAAFDPVALDAAGVGGARDREGNLVEAQRAILDRRGPIAVGQRAGDRLVLLPEFEGSVVGTPDPLDVRRHDVQHRLAPAAASIFHADG